MCGRFSNLRSWRELHDLYRITDKAPALNVPARYNIAPTQDVLAVRFNPETGERTLDPLRWGLVPHWAKDIGIGNRLINARAEGVAVKPSFRQAFAKRRCLIPADAFYEWRAPADGKGPKQPYAIRMADGHPFAFAGLWENWKDPAGEWVRTCTIITTTANELVARLHDRMPVILAPQAWPKWLGEDPAEPDDLQGMLAPFPADAMEAFPVGRQVNNVRNDGPDLLVPLTR